MGDFINNTFGDLYYQDDNGDFHKLGKFCEVTLTEDAAKNMEHAELEEVIPDGINIHITGKEINRIDNVCVYFKEVK